MHIPRQFTAAAIVAAASLLSACGSTETTTTVTPISSRIDNSYGVVDSIQLVQVETEKKNSGVGAVTGGIIGGVLGNTVGGGTGKAVATVAGVVGGAVVGNKIEQNGDAPQTHDVYQVVVHMDHGGYQTITQDSIADLHAGVRVRIENNRVYRM